MEINMAKSPNIVFILADDHGYGDISAHNGPSIQTPHIDRIAEEGIRLTQFMPIHLSVHQVAHRS